MIIPFLTLLGYRSRGINPLIDWSICGWFACFLSMLILYNLWAYTMKLYRNINQQGKVCLSYFGTIPWQGDSGEYSSPLVIALVLFF